MESNIFTKVISSDFQSCYGYELGNSFEVLSKNNTQKNTKKRISLMRNSARAVQDEQFESEVTYYQ